MMCDKTEKEKMIDAEMYNPLDEVLVAERQHAHATAHELNLLSPMDIEKKQQLVKKLLPNTGENTYITPPIYCDYGYNVIAGKNFYTNFNCVFLDICKITIGDDVMLAPNVQIYAAGHPTDPVARYSGFEFGKPVNIGDRVWIGGGVIILPGVNIGSDTVIGAGSVVTKDVPAGVVAAGNPCRVLRAAK